MLSVSTYPQAYVDACRGAVDAQLAAYRALCAAAGRDGDAQLGAAFDAFEPRFLNHMVLALDQYFVHRARTQEGKDGNPLNEVRVLCTSIMSNDARLAAEKTIRLKPEKSVLGYSVGDEITLGEGDFARLAKAFFAEIESRFVAP